MRKKGLGRKRINNVLTVLGKLLAYAEEIEIIEQAQSMYLLKVEPPKFKFLDFDEYEALLRAAEEEPEWRIAAMLAGSAGLRLGEIRAFQWSDWEKMIKKITISQSFYKGTLGATKGWNLRTIPLVSRLHHALKECRHLRGQFVVCNPMAVRRRSARCERRCRAFASGPGWTSTRGTRCGTRSARTWLC